MHYTNTFNEKIIHNYSSTKDNLKLYYHSSFDNDELTITITIENTSSSILKDLTLYIYDFSNQNLNILTLKGIKTYNNRQVTFYIDPLNKNEIAKIIISTPLLKNHKSKTIALFKNNEHIFTYNE